MICRAVAKHVFQLHLVLRLFSCQRTSEERKRNALYLKFPQALSPSELLTAAKF